MTVRGMLAKLGTPGVRCAAARRPLRPHGEPMSHLPPVGSDHRRALGRIKAAGRGAIPIRIEGTVTAVERLVAELRDTYPRVTDPPHTAGLQPTGWASGTSYVTVTGSMDRLREILDRHTVGTDDLETEVLR